MDDPNVRAHAYFARLLAIRVGIPVNGLVAPGMIVWWVTAEDPLMPTRVYAAITIVATLAGLVAGVVAVWRPAKGSWPAGVMLLGILIAIGMGGNVLATVLFPNSFSSPGVSPTP